MQPNVILRGDLLTHVMEANAADSMFIADKVFPPYEVDLRAGQYVKFEIGPGQLLSDQSAERSATGTYGRIRRTTVQDTYLTVDRGLEELIDDDERRDNERFFDQEVTAARLTARNVRLGHERRVAAQLINASNFTATAAAVNYTEALIATVDFPRDLMDAVDRLNAVGAQANTIVMSQAVLNRIKRSTRFQNWIKGLNAAATSYVTDGMIVRSFAEDYGITNLLVGKLSYDSSKTQKTISMSPVWANTHIWIGDVKDGDPQNGGAGRTLTWTDVGGLLAVESYRDDARRSDVVRVRNNTAEKVIDGTCGQLITTNFA